jgi:predicted dehydrogenase
MWLNGPIDTVTAMTETFVKERTHSLTGQKQEVTIDDAAAFLARFANGSLATFEATRYARGHKAQYTLEINGENASIAWICTICTGCTISTTATRGGCAAGARCISPTATILI